MKQWLRKLQQRFKKQRSEQHPLWEYKVVQMVAQAPDNPEDASRMFRYLSEARMNIEIIATSEIGTSCVVAESDRSPPCRPSTPASGWEAAPAMRRRARSRKTLKASNKTLYFQDKTL